MIALGREIDQTSSVTSHNNMRKYQVKIKLHKKNPTLINTCYLFLGAMIIWVRKKRGRRR